MGRVEHSLENTEMINLAIVNIQLLILILKQAAVLELCVMIGVRKWPKRIGGMIHY